MKRLLVAGVSALALSACADAKGYFRDRVPGQGGCRGGQVFFHGRDLAKLTASELLVGDATIQKRTTFVHSCR